MDDELWLTPVHPRDVDEALCYVLSLAVEQQQAAVLELAEDTTPPRACLVAPDLRLYERF